MRFTGIPTRGGWDLFRAVGFGLPPVFVFRHHAGAMDVSTLDRLQSIGCNVTVAGFKGWAVRLSLQHDGDCGHHGSGNAERCEEAIRAAVRGLLKAADGSKCNEAEVVAELRRIALAVGG